jgi:hypothetical protein
LITTGFAEALSGTAKSMMPATSAKTDINATNFPFIICTSRFLVLCFCVSFAVQALFLWTVWSKFQVAGTAAIFPAG